MAGLPLHPLVVHGQPSVDDSSHAASHRIASHRIASHRIASHRIASHRIASHRIASHRIASHRIALYQVYTTIITHQFTQYHITSYPNLQITLIATYSIVSHHKCLKITCTSYNIIFGVINKSRAKHAFSIWSAEVCIVKIIIRCENLLGMFTFFFFLVLLPCSFKYFPLSLYFVSYRYFLDFILLCSPFLFTICFPPSLSPFLPPSHPPSLPPPTLPPTHAQVACTHPRKFLNHVGQDLLQAI